MEIIKFTTPKLRKLWSREMFIHYIVSLQENLQINNMVIINYENYNLLVQKVESDKHMTYFVESIKPDFNIMEIRVCQLINRYIQVELDVVNKEYEKRCEEYEIRKSQVSKK